jgi:flagellum-specific peptidoglycan hydrolase FlgJ
MFNYNFGGIKGTGPNGASVARRAREGRGLDARGGDHRFRAYATAAEGARDYLELLAKRYRPALEAAERGDTAGFVQSLWTGGHFTGDERVYLRQVAYFVALALDRGFGALGTSTRNEQVPL